MEKLAKLLNGREVGDEISREEEAQAEKDGLVVVFGYSDDNMEFRGAIHDEVGCYDGGAAYLDKNGLVVNECDDEDCPYFERIKESARKIEAIWGEGEYSWSYKTDIPHTTFDVMYDEIMEDGQKYCKGIVFRLKDIG